jgi:hypothetical protein
MVPEPGTYGAPTRDIHLKCDVRMKRRCRRGRIDHPGACKGQVWFARNGIGQRHRGWRRLAIILYHYPSIGILLGRTVYHGTNACNGDIKRPVSSCSLGCRPTNECWRPSGGRSPSGWCRHGWREPTRNAVVAVRHSLLDRPPHVPCTVYCRNRLLRWRPFHPYGKILTTAQAVAYT